jgi:hypothetical protein
MEMDEEANVRLELQELMSRRGLPGELQREVYHAVLPIIRRYIDMKKGHMNEFRILGLAIEAVKEAWISAK